MKYRKELFIGVIPMLLLTAGLSWGIEVTTPSYVERWYVGNTYTIKWNPQGLGGDVKIEYSRDAGVSWDPVAGALEQVLGGSAVTPAAVQDWVHIGNSTTTGYVDWQADNYWDDNKVWYRVRAIDTQGNATKPSNEVYIYRPLQQ